MTIDTDTAKWILNAADEKAAAAGMRFDVERAEWACSWIELNCCLYEGDLAGQPLTLYPAQRDFISRLYGWVRWSDEWGQWVRRFTHATFLAAKKNGKSPLAAAHNLYLLCGDNEPGQKVYQAAANGEQAKIAQMHAINMVRQSPALDADCKINNTTLQILHKPTNSVLMILSGDDSRGARAKEGLNGSVTYDEMHVVNRQIEERTSRAGISRKEPINAAFSTAGDDPSAVGSERFRYGRQVNSGERSDPHFLHVEYSAPQKATDAEIEEHLEEYGRQANPAWGLLVKPTEFRADWERSKGNPREVARFKQYRLDIEVGSTNQWLDLAGWGKGQRVFTLADLAGRDCFVGLDLSRTRDMTGAALLFPWPEDGDEAVRVWPMGWMPEDTAKERDHLFPFKSWAAGGFLTLTSGGVVDYRAVKSDLRAAVAENKLNVLGLYFDQHYAEELTQQLVDGDADGEGWGCERVAVTQSVTGLSGLSKEFERRVSAGLIHHPGNPVMTWQVGHCEVWADRNQNIRPSKPSPKSGKSIDIIAATVDAMAGVLAAPVERVIAYADRGPLIL
jgi:phage terminase large subunit-like protein